MKNKSYRAVTNHTHPRASSAHQVLEHILVAEKALGRFLPEGAVVHHVNGDPQDNRPSNLVICQDKSYHNFLHKRIRIRQAGGDPNTDRLCGTCKRIVPKHLMNKGYRVGSNGSRSERCECNRCSAERMAKKKLERQEQVRADDHKIFNSEVGGRANEVVVGRPYQSIGGLAVEVSGLPVIGGPEHIANRMKYEIAAQELREHYPELLIVKSAHVNGDGLIFWVTYR